MVRQPWGYKVDLVARWRVEKMDVDGLIFILQIILTITNRISIDILFYFLSNRPNFKNCSI